MFCFHCLLRFTHIILIFTLWCDFPCWTSHWLVDTLLFFRWWSICFAPIAFHLSYSTSYTSRLSPCLFLTYPLPLLAPDAARLKKDSGGHRWNLVPRSSSCGGYRPMEFGFGFLIFLRTLLVQALVFEVWLTGIVLDGCHSLWRWW